MKIVIGNLPEGVAEADVEELMAQYADVTSVDFLDEGEAGSDRSECLVGVRDPSRAAADAIVDRLNGYYWRGVQITARVPMFQDGDDAPGET